MMGAILQITLQVDRFPKFGKFGSFQVSKVNNFFYSSAHQFTFPIGYGKKANSQILSKIKIKFKKKPNPVKMTFMESLSFKCEKETKRMFCQRPIWATRVLRCIRYWKLVS
jgi:hypothetical protein